MKKRNFNKVLECKKNYEIESTKTKKMQSM